MFDFFKKNKEKEKKLWQKFESKKNTEDVLIEKAKALAPIIILSISEDLKLLSKTLKKNMDILYGNKFNEIIYEMTLFYLHLVDRVAFQYLNVNQRNIFADTLFINIREILSGAYESETTQTQFRSLFSKVYDERQNEYAQYKKLFAENNEGTNGTLYWEFGKKIAGILDLETKEKLLAIFQIQWIQNSISVLQLPVLFKE